MNSGVIGKTAKDKKIAASLQSFKVGRALKDIGNYVRELETNLSDGTSNTVLKRKAELIKRATFSAAHGVTFAARNSCVISGAALEYTVNRTEVQAKRRRVEAEAALPPPVTRRHNPVRRLPKPRCSDVQKSVERFLGDVIQETQDLPTRKQPSRLVPEVSPSMPEESLGDAPTPSNGILFTPTEVFNHLGSIMKALRGKMMDAMIENNQVPVTSRKAIQEMIRKAKEPSCAPPETWGARGRKAHLSVDELETAVSSLGLLKGGTWGIKEVTEHVAAVREAKAAKQGMKVTSVIDACCSRTNKNYMAQLVTMKGISLSTSAIQKTNRRFTAENSLMSAMSFACAVAHSHFIVGSPSSGK